MYCVYAVFECLSHSLFHINVMVRSVKGLVRSLERNTNTHFSQVMIFSIPDIHEASPPCGPGDVSGGGPAE